MCAETRTNVVRGKLRAKRETSSSFLKVEIFKESESSGGVCRKETHLQLEAGCLPLPHGGAVPPPPWLVSARSANI